MPMTIIIETDGGISEFVMKPIDRKSRQATTKRVAVDAQGRECSRAMLSYDGLILTAGTTTDNYEDKDGNGVEHGEVMQVDACGHTLLNLPATTGRVQRPVGPVEVELLLEHTVIKAFALLPAVIANDLRDSLASSNVYQVAFRPRASVIDHPAFMLANSSGIFLLQCRPCLTQFIRLDQPVIQDSELDDEEELWDDWQMSSHADSIGGDAW
ncbi:MAG: hypothetical protein ACYC1M_18910 [Armatimonadota bacterium]